MWWTPEEQAFGELAAALVPGAPEEEPPGMLLWHVPEDVIILPGEVGGGPDPDLVEGLGDHELIPLIHLPPMGNGPGHPPPSPPHLNGWADHQPSPPGGPG